MTRCLSLGLPYVVLLILARFQLGGSPIVTVRAISCLENLLLNGHLSGQVRCHIAAWSKGTVTFEDLLEEISRGYNNDLSIRAEELRSLWQEEDACEELIEYPLEDPEEPDYFGFSF